MVRAENVLFSWLLQSTSQVVEMRPKNLECVKMVFALALSDGNSLGTAWYPVLNCISQVGVVCDNGDFVLAVGPPHEDGDCWHAHLYCLPERKAACHRVGCEGR